MRRPPGASAGRYTEPPPANAHRNVLRKQMVCGVGNRIPHTRQLAEQRRSGSSSGERGGLFHVTRASKIMNENSYFDATYSSVLTYLLNIKEVIWHLGGFGILI